MVAALSLIAEIEFAGGTPQIGPPADINPWDIYVVGYPYWFWTDGPTSLTDSEESLGVEVSLEATATSVTFTTGDGGSVTCDPASAPAWGSSVAPEEPSPSCGYTWERRSATPDHPDATHTVTATTTWEVDWTAGDASGTEVVQRSESVDVVVGELQALVTG
ncbi:hypothetical protein DT076_05705 [Desertihabitans brevis]|uniref:ATP/GTP-binding protein n=1 Tax=Desertihabitans brevis TaxID=2268447 RepID=A0A367YYZ0_9ACTN|nr:hypothetical protein [Desertihabitans brevis]RCK70171.1 hypothetical protein DT076_05705 [Desertihabitans brevis]